MPGTRTARGSYNVGGTREPKQPSPTATPVRSTEGPQPGKRGRPKGSRNKPKGIIPSELTEKMLPALQKQLSPESFEYVEGVLKKGKPIQTRRELDVMIAMLARNLMAALTDETLSLAEVGFRKDITERLKILNSMLTLRHQIEKNSDDGSKPGESVLIKLVGDRQLLDNGRLGVLVGLQPGSLVGDADRAGRAAPPPRTVPDQVLERPLPGESGEQVEADWLLDSDSSGGAAQGSDHPGVQGELHLDQPD